MIKTTITAALQHARESVQLHPSGRSAWTVAEFEPGLSGWVGTVYPTHTQARRALADGRVVHALTALGVSDPWDYMRPRDGGRIPDRVQAALRRYRTGEID